METASPSNKLTDTRASATNRLREATAGGWLYRHAGRGQTWQRCLEALADGLPLPWPPENLLHRPLRQRQGWGVLARRRAARARQSQRSAQGRQRPKHREAARQAQAGRRPAFRAMADEWLAKKKVEKVKRGRIVAVRDPKTIEVLELRVGYIKDRFGKLCRQEDRKSTRLNSSHVEISY